MTTRFEEIYRFGPRDVLTDEALNRRFKDLDDRTSKAEIVRLSEDQAFSLVLDRVLARSEAVIASLRDRLLSITELQWLTAHSDTSRTLAVGAQFALEIIEAERDLFAPGPYAVLSWTGGDPGDYAVVRTLGFDRLIGQWDIRIEAFVGGPGPWDDWQIAAVAGATLAQMALLTDGQAIRAETLAARNTAIDKAGEADAAREAAQQADAAAGEKLAQTTALRGETLEFRNAAGGHSDTAQQAAAAAAQSAAIVDPAALTARFLAIEAVTTREARIRHSWFYGS